LNIAPLFFRLRFEGCTLYTGRQTRAMPMQIYQNGQLLCDITEYQEGAIENNMAMNVSTPFARRRSVLFRTTVQPCGGTGIH
jgi:hypothetical protein